MGVDISKLFDESLPRALAKHADEARQIRATFQLNIEGAGAWFLDLTSSGPSVTVGERPADCTVSLSAADFERLYEQPSVGMQLFFSGRLKVRGNPMLGMKLQKLFSFR